MKTSIDRAGSASLPSLLAEVARERAAAARAAAEAGPTDAQRAKAKRIAQLLTARERGAARPRRAPLRRLGAWSAWGASFAAMAAAVALYVAHVPREVEPSPIAYVASVTGHVARERSAGLGAAAVLVARPDAVFEVVLNATSPVSITPSATVLAVRGGSAARMDVPVEVSTSGSVRFEVPGSALAGVSELRVAVSRAAAPVVIPVVAPGR